MAKFPKTVNILGREYQVNVITDEFFVGGTYGKIYFDKRIIEIVRTEHINFMYEILFHEMAHGWMFHSGYDDPKVKFTHEQICDVIAGYTERLLSENPFIRQHFSTLPRAKKQKS